MCSLSACVRDDAAVAPVAVRLNLQRMLLRLYSLPLKSVKSKMSRWHANHNGQRTLAYLKTPL